MVFALFLRTHFCFIIGKFEERIFKKRSSFSGGDRFHLSPERAHDPLREKFSDCF